MRCYLVAGVLGVVGLFTSALMFNTWGPLWGIGALVIGVVTACGFFSYCQKEKE